MQQEPMSGKDFSVAIFGPLTLVLLGIAILSLVAIAAQTAVTGSVVP